MPQKKGATTYCFTVTDLVPKWWTGRTRSISQGRQRHRNRNREPGSSSRWRKTDAEFEFIGSAKSVTGAQFRIQIWAVSSLFRIGYWDFWWQCLKWNRIAFRLCGAWEFLCLVPWNLIFLFCCYCYFYFPIVDGDMCESILADIVFRRYGSSFIVCRWSINFSRDLHIIYGCVIA